MSAPRRASRVDANQAEIAEALRAFGATVVSTASLGDGFPDLIVGYLRRNFLMEVKDWRKPPSARRLTPDEEEFASTWRGQVAEVGSVESALRLLGGKF